MPASEMTAQQFFDEEMPRFIEAAVLAPKRTGDVVFAIAGDDGGRWRLHLAKRPHIERVDPWVRGDLLVSMSASCFPAFYAGTLDLAAEVERGAMSVAGDLSLFDELAAMWRSPVSMIALRAGGKSQP